MQSLRTWGGVVGITEHGPLLDGGNVFVPEFASADEHGQWVIEGHGVDPQLERGVEELMKQLPSTPAGLPQQPAAPNKAGGL